MKIRFTLLACSLIFVVVSTMPARAQAPEPHLSDDQKVLNEILRLDKEERFAFRDQRLAHIEAQASRIDGLTLTYEKRDSQNFGSSPVFHMQNNTDISLGYVLTWQMSTGSHPIMEYSFPGILKPFEKQEHESILADPFEGWNIPYGSIQITWWAHWENFAGSWNMAHQGDEQRTDGNRQVPPPISSGAIYLSETADSGERARCDGIGREVFAAIDEGALDKATALTDTFESRCGGLASSYASRAQLARSQINMLRAADAMPQRTTGYGTSLFKSAVQQATVEAQDPAARQARLQAERAALEEQIAREATSGGDGSRFVNSMLGVMQVTAAVQNARNGAQVPIVAQPLAPFQAQTQAQAIFQAALPAQMPSPQQSQWPGPQQPSQSHAAQQQAQFQAQQQAQVDAMNAEVARQAEADRLQAEHLQEQLKYYPSQNQCAAVVMSSRDPVAWCVKNNCNVTIEVHFSGGMMSVSPGMCRGVSGSQAPTIFGICGHNDWYDSARQQCKGS